MYTAGKISTCYDVQTEKLLATSGIKSQKFMDKIYMPRACGHALMSSPAMYMSQLPQHMAVLFKESIK